MFFEPPPRVSSPEGTRLACRATVHCLPPMIEGDAPGASPAPAGPAGIPSARVAVVAWSIVGALFAGPFTGSSQTVLLDRNAAAAVQAERTQADAAPLLGIQDGEGRKNPVGAAILGAYVPLAGYAYAGNWKRGIAPQVLWFAFAGGMSYASDCGEGPAARCSSTQETVGAVAWAAGVASVFWGGIGSYRTARSRNRALDERFGIEVRPASGGGVRMEFRVPHRAGR